jgi:hypothetical protein
VYVITDALQMDCLPLNKSLLIGLNSYVLKTGSGFTCVECGKEFNDKSNCRRHAKISHNLFVGELFWEYCHKAYKNNYALKDHLRKTHGVYNNAV